MKPTSWTYSSLTEAYRLYTIATDISGGFFYTNNFPVLPLGQKVRHRNLVLFPELAYTSIPRFWEKVQYNKETSFPDSKPGQIILDLEKLLLKSGFSPLNYHRLQTDWTKIESAILDHIYQLLPNMRSAVRSLHVYPTRFGTTTSFCLPRKFPADIDIYIRADQTVYEILEALLSALTRNTVFTKLSGSWSESEIIVDWLITQTSLSQIIKPLVPLHKYTATIPSTRFLQKGNILTMSDNYYQRLGVPQRQNIFSLTANGVQIFQQDFAELTTRENQILAALITHPDHFLTYDDLANIIFKQENNFSLYVIAKIIQNIRTKMEKHGLSGNYLQTIRAKGLILRGVTS